MYKSRTLNLLCAFAKECISFVMPVRLSVRLSTWNNSAPNGRIFMKFDIGGFFENLSRNFKFLLKSDKKKLYFT